MLNHDPTTCVEVICWRCVDASREMRGEERDQDASGASPVEPQTDAEPVSDLRVGGEDSEPGETRSRDCPSVVMVVRDEHIDTEMWALVDQAQDHGVQVIFENAEVFSQYLTILREEDEQAAAASEG